MTPTPTFGGGGARDFRVARPGVPGFTRWVETSEFKFFCSHCDQPLRCEVRFAGRQIQCPGCKHLIRIPNPPAGLGFTHVSPESGRTWDTHIHTPQKP
jgi:hypothetical protein